jgi:hypothetical protein
MRLSDVFEKLGKVKVRTLFRWWGKLTLYIFLGFAVSLVLFTVGSLLFSVFSGLPWWLSLILVFLVGGLVAFAVTPDEDY